MSETTGASQVKPEEKKEVTLKKKPVAPKGKKTPAMSSKLTEEQKKLQEENRKLRLEKEALEMKLASVDRAPAVQESNETDAVIENLKLQVEALARKADQAPIYRADGKKEKYRPVTPDDIQEDSVTFYSRCTYKVVSGHMDEHNREILPPHKIIKMQFAASDIRQDGKEQEILNFCSYTTKLKSEIEYMRSNPEYGIVITEGMKEAAGHNVKEYQFKTRAAEQVASMSPESIVDHARAMDIPNRDTKSIRDLKLLIVEAMVKEFVNQAKALSDDLTNKLLQQAAKTQFVIDR